MLDLPPRFLAVRYDAARIPGCDRPHDLSRGANCQVFAFEVLRHFGWMVPDYRSSELWADRDFLREVTRPEPLDLLFYNATYEAYGAHVGVVAGDGMVLHLSRANGRPRYEAHTDLMRQPAYACFLGARRAMRRQIRPVHRKRYR